MIDQKQLENVEYFKYLGSMLTNDGRCIVKLNPGLPWQKLNLTRRGIFYYYIGLKIEEETSKMLHLEHSLIWCSNLDASSSKSETLGKF